MDRESQHWRERFNLFRQEVVQIVPVSPLANDGHGIAARAGTIQLIGPGVNPFLPASPLPNGGHGIAARAGTIQLSRPRLIHISFDRE